MTDRMETSRLQVELDTCLKRAKIRHTDVIALACAHGDREPDATLLLRTRRLRAEMPYRKAKQILDAAKSEADIERLCREAGISLRPIPAC